MVTHSSILPGKSYEQRSQVGYSPWGCERTTKPTYQETIAIEKVDLYSQFSRRGGRACHGKATWGSFQGPSGGREEGELGQELLVWFLWYRIGETRYTDLGNDFSRLWGM